MLTSELSLSSMYQLKFFNRKAEHQLEWALFFASDCGDSSTIAKSDRAGFKEFFLWTKIHSDCSRWVPASAARELLRTISTCFLLSIGLYLKTRAWLLTATLVWLKLRVSTPSMLLLCVTSFYGKFYITIRIRRCWISMLNRQKRVSLIIEELVPVLKAIV